MDTAMRDLDHLHERSDDDSPGRKAAMLAMAGISTVALVFAMGVILGGSSDVESTVDDDPLAALSAVLPADDGANSAESEATPTTNEADLVAGEVSFHGQLTDERPEVEAALAAAAAEGQMLDARGSVQGTPLLARSTPGAAREATPPPSVATLPAGDIARIPTAGASESGRRPASVGRDGAYTIQVASYRTQDEATLFADALRARGHTAFTARVDLPARGVYFRVRLGPFESRVAADRYRATFEREEGMNTYVVDSARAAAQESVAD